MAFTREHQRTPSLTDLADGLGLSTGAVRGRLHGLEAGGYIERGWYEHGFRILAGPHGRPAVLTFRERPTSGVHPDQLALPLEGAG